MAQVSLTVGIAVTLVAYLGLLAAVAHAKRHVQRHAGEREDADDAEAAAE